MNSDSARIDDLIIRHFEASLTTGEEIELADLLAGSSDARQLLQQYMRLEGEQIELGIAGFYDELRSDQNANDLGDTDELGLVRPTPSDQVRTPGINFAFIGWVAVAVAITILLIAPWVAKPTLENAVVSRPQAVAHFSRLVNVVWSNTDGSDVGETIYPGTIEIHDGLAEIEFNNGAIVIVEGPARLDVATKNRAFLHFGRVRSIVPSEAYGFTVESADVKVVDLGTEFGFEVDPDGIAEVHVFDGEIEMYEGHERLTKRLLSAGQAIQFERTGWLREIPADERAFVDAETLAARATAFVEQLRAEVKTLSKTQRELFGQRKRLEAELRNSPDLVQLRADAEAARKAADVGAKTDRVVSKAIEDRKEIQALIDKKIKSKLGKSDQGKQLIEKLDQIDAKLSSVKDRMNKRPKDRGPMGTMRKLASETRDLQKRRTDLRTKIRKEGGRLRKNDPDVRKTVSQLSKAKRKLDKALQNSEVLQLRQHAESLRKKFLDAQNARLQNDPELVAIRGMIDDLSGKIKHKRKQINQARTQTMEDHLSDGLLDSELFESDDVEVIDSNDLELLEA